MEKKKIDVIRGRMKCGRSVVYPVPEVILFLKRKIKAESNNKHLEKLFNDLENNNPSGLISQKELEIQTGGLIKVRNLNNLYSLWKKQNALQATEV